MYINSYSIEYSYIHGIIPDIPNNTYENTIFLHILQYSFEYSVIMPNNGGLLWYSVVLPLLSGISAFIPVKLREKT